jgi:hypothetical protein
MLVKNVLAKSPSEGSQHIVSIWGNRDQVRSSKERKPNVERRNELKNRKITDPRDQGELLLYYAAALAVVLNHERNYRAIFGSQLELLMQMDIERGMGPSAARAFYDAAKAATPNAYGYCLRAR